ncbi:MAG: nucleotide sugar dehydrogenase [Nitrososphaeria archaeon]
MICVFGLGQVGLPSAVVFAYKGYSVIGVDIDGFKVNSVNQCVSYIKEPKLEILLKKVVSEGRLRAVVNADNFLRECNMVIVDVPTPVKAGVIDLSHVINVLKTTARNLCREMLIVIESTVPVGTTGNLAKKILEEGSNLRAEEDFYLAHVPERISPGKAIEELLNTPRVVGGLDLRSTKKALEMYSKVNPNLIPTDATTAEFVKLIENTFRDINIAYANFLALISQSIGVDVYEAIKLANTHPRVSIHLPGAGVGGPCLTKDPYMLLSILKDFWGSELIKIARKINEYMPQHFVELVKYALSENNIDIRRAKVAVFGAAYKGGVEDVRESPSKYVVRGLLDMKLDVLVYDPYTSETFGGKRANSIEDAVENADAIVFVTDHPEFKEIDLNKLTKAMRNKIIIDGRRIIDPYKAYTLGFKYYGIGFGRKFKL